MIDGTAGILLLLILIICGAEFPQLLFAVTVMLPLDRPAIALIVFEVEVPVHPVGKFQV